MIETKSKWNTLSICVVCPEGKVYVQILENSPGSIYRIFMNVGKSGSVINSHCYAMAELVSKLFDLGQGINQVITMLSGITSDRSTKVLGVEARSVPEALTIALMKYRTTIPRVKYDREPVRFRRSDG